MLEVLRVGDRARERPAGMSERLGPAWNSGSALGVRRRGSGASFLLKGVENTGCGTGDGGGTGGVWDWSAGGGRWKSSRKTLTLRAGNASAGNRDDGWELLPVT